MSQTEPSASTPANGAVPASATPAGPPDFAAPGAPTGFPPTYPAPGAYPSPQSYAPQAYPAQPSTPQSYAPQAYPAQPSTPQPYPAQSYPAQPYPPQQPSVSPQAYAQQPSAPQPYAQQPYAQQPPVGQPADWAPGAVAPTREERVGRGVLFSLGGIVVGVVLTVVLWKIGFFASITSFAMAYATVWLYAKGAGAPPRKGVPAVIGVIVVGVVVSLSSIVAADALDYLASDYPDATLAQKADFVLYNILRPEVWQDYTSSAAMFVIFAALGTFGLIRQLGRARRA